MRCSQHGTVCNCIQTSVILLSEIEMVIIQNTKFDTWNNSCNITDYSKRSTVKKPDNK